MSDNTELIERLRQGHMEVLGECISHSHTTMPAYPCDNVRAADALAAAEGEKEELRPYSHAVVRAIADERDALRSQLAEMKAEHTGCIYEKRGERVTPDEEWFHTEALRWFGIDPETFPPDPSRVYHVRKRRVSPSSDTGAGDE